MRMFLRIIGYLGLFLASFGVFLYLTFPYAMLTETVSSFVYGQTGVSLRIGSLRPRLPLGIRLSEVSATLPDVLDADLAEVSVAAHVGALMTGTPAIGLMLQSENGGSLELDVADTGAATVSYLTESPSRPNRFDWRMIPGSVNLEADRFSLDQVFANLFQNLGSLAQFPPHFASIVSLAQQIVLEGKLAGSVNVDMNREDPTLSTGQVQLELKDALLDLSALAQTLAQAGTQGLTLPNQDFSRARLDARLAGGTLTVQEPSGLESEDVVLDVSGEVVLNERPERSQMDITVLLTLRGALAEGGKGIASLAGQGRCRAGEPILIKVRGSIFNPTPTVC